MNDSRAVTDSGIATRWASHYTPNGPGMIGDKGYQSSGLLTRTKNPSARISPRHAGLSTTSPETLRSVTKLEIYRWAG
jgi:hypothetical protein